jgi:hypothetical protein
LFSIFICSALFYSCNSRSAEPLGNKTHPVKEATTISPGMAMR